MKFLKEVIVTILLRLPEGKGQWEGNGKTRGTFGGGGY